MVFGFQNLNNWNTNEDAQKHLERAIEINPKFAEAHFELVLLLVEQDKLKKARKHFENDRD